MDPRRYVPEEIRKVAGPLVVGYLTHWGLFGVLSMQVYMYYLAFADDSRRHKAVVYGVYLLEIIQTIIMTRSAFHAFGEDFGNLEALDEIGLQWLGVPLISAMVGFLAEGVYAYRLKVLSDSNFVTGLVLTLATIQLGGGIGLAFQIKDTPYFSQVPRMRIFIAGGIWNGGTFLCNVTIAIFMTYYLVRGKNRSEIKQTQVFLAKIIRLTIETGIITAALALINFTIALLPGHPTYWVAISAVLGTVYSISMMAVFNSRMKVSRKIPPLEVNFISNLMAGHQVMPNGSIGNAIQLHGGIQQEGHIPLLTPARATKMRS
ncbi:hypothetical protein B0H34DRAFT_778645 [Crassisporium funariophilum]|nr:hypothetical protein B0H34DRAFT_778645 [Crassisporium funariophilum]